MSSAIELDAMDYNEVIDCYQANLDSQAHLSVQGLFNDLVSYKDERFANMIVEAIENETIITMKE